jgi:hypothetical protein
VEYFRGSWHGMLLGAMLVRRVIRDGKEALNTYSLTVWSEGTRVRTTHRCLGTDFTRSYLLSGLYPELPSFRSDSTSCLAHHDNIAYMHHFEQGLVSLTYCTVDLYRKRRSRRARDDWTLTFHLSTSCFILCPERK